MKFIAWKRRGIDTFWYLDTEDRCWVAEANNPIVRNWRWFLVDAEGNEELQSEERAQELVYAHQVWMATKDAKEWRLNRKEFRQTFIQEVREGETQPSDIGKRRRKWRFW